MNSKNVLVTGAMEYIGSHICKALAQAGYLPVVCDNFVYGHKWAVKWEPLEIRHIEDRAKLYEVIVKHQSVAAIHFGGYAYVGESVTDPGKYYRNNVAGSFTILETTRNYGKDKIIC